jgi:hypothetical protein
MTKGYVYQRLIPYLLAKRGEWVTYKTINKAFSIPNDKMLHFHVRMAEADMFFTKEYYTIETNNGKIRIL